MTVIDAHQHFWKYHPVSHQWIDDAMAVIRRDFLPEDLEPVLVANGVDGCVLVQADDTAGETKFLLELAGKHAFIKGVVAWVDLMATDIHEQLARLQSIPAIKGFRHILQAQEPAFMLQPAFRRGIGALQAFGFTYDLLLHPRHLPAAIELVQQFPGQRFVVDHLAKPFIKNKALGSWQTNLEALAKYPNVYCKISGMVTEADYQQWTPADFVPYLDTVTAAFGTQRLIFGSDWPICLVAASYPQMMQLVKDYYAGFSADVQANIFGGNAIRFYKL